MSIKYFLFFILSILFWSCSSMVESRQRTVADHMLGKWHRTNDEEGRETFEQWRKENSNRYVGLGYTLIGTDTVFREDIILEDRNGQWVFEVTGVNEQPTSFQVISMNEDSLVCENATNEFPTKIAYFARRDSLIAIVSSDEFSIDFSFVKDR